MLRVPAHWRKSFNCLKGSGLTFEAHIERDQHGGIFIVFRKITESEFNTSKKRKQHSEVIE